MALVPFPNASPRRQDDDETGIQRNRETVEEEDGDGARMSFLEHLDELRKRLIYCVYGLLGGVIIAFIFINRIFRFVLLPLQQRLPEGGTFITTEGPEYLMLYLKVALLAGLFIGMPFIVWQLWLFIAPGLYSHEKRFAIPFVLFASLFFFAGAAFAHYIAFPWTWDFFVTFSSGEFVTFMPKIGPTFSLYVKVLLGFGLIFQMPTVVWFLARMDLVTAGFLARNFKYAVLGIFIVAAVISPGTDVVSQALMAGPMLALYGLSIVIAWVVAPRKKSIAAS
jgi:sec-independent protein translocase protein TatC